jgi:hypothetical protein
MPLLLFERFSDPLTAALGLVSSAAELVFLQTHGSSSANPSCSMPINKIVVDG